MAYELDTGKWVILICGFFCCFLGASLPYVNGIIHTELLLEFGKSDIETSWAGTLTGSFFCLGGPIASFLTNIFSSRVCIITGCVCCLFGFGLSSLAEDLFILYFTYGIVAALGQSLIYIGTVISVGYHFDKYRSLATGIVVNGCGLGLFVLPIVVSKLIQQFRIQGTFLFMAACTFQCAVFGALMKPNKVEIQQKEKHEVHLTNKRHCVKSIKQILTILRNVPFLLFCMSTFCWNASTNISFLYFPKYFYNQGTSISDSSYLMSAIGIGNICGRYFTGLAAVDKQIGSRLLYVGQFFLIGVLTLFLPFYKSFAVRFLYMISFGLYTGGVWTIMSSIVVEIIGISKFATGLGLVMLTAGLGQLFVPVIGDWVFVVMLLQVTLTLFRTERLNTFLDPNIIHHLLFSGINAEKLSTMPSLPIVKKMCQTKADIAVGPISVMTERENAVDFTVHYYDLVGLTILMKKPEFDYKLFKFFEVLDNYVWLCIIAAFFLFSSLLYAFDKFGPYSYQNYQTLWDGQEPEPRVFTFKEGIWFCVMSLTPQSKQILVNDNQSMKKRNKTVFYFG